MSLKKEHLNILRVVGLVCLSGLFFVEEARAGTLPKAGVTLPAIRLESPLKKEEIRYLGLDQSKTFTLDKIASPMVLIEIIGVYCPECHIQIPVLNQLFNRLNKDLQRSKKIKMLAIAIGATSMEVDYLKKEHRILFPVIKDQEFVIHKQLGEPRTPFTLLVTKDRKVLFAHLGVIEDYNQFMERLKPFIQ